MIIYISGVVLASAINLLKILISYSRKFSIKVKNISKVRGKYNFLTGEFTETKDSAWKNLFIVVDALAITPLLSWIVIGYWGISFIKNLLNKPAVPESVKEIQFRLSTIVMDKNQVIECLKDFVKVLGVNTSNLTHRTISDNNEEDPNELILSKEVDENNWYTEITIDSGKMQYTRYSRVTGDVGEFYDTYEFKIDGKEVLERQIEDKTEYPGDITYDIKDNVVLEQDVRSRMTKGFHNNTEDIEKRINNLKASIEWRNLTGNRIKNFILFRCSDKSDLELRRYMRSEFERIKKGYTALETEINRLGCYIDPTEKYIKVKRKEDTPEEKCREVYDMLDDGMEGKFGITYNEFNDYGNICEDLERYLTRLST